MSGFFKDLCVADEHFFRIKLTTLLEFNSLRALTVKAKRNLNGAQQKHWTGYAFFY